MKTLLLCFTATLLISSSAFARGQARGCANAEVKKENLALVMSILNKNNINYRVAKITGSKKLFVVAQVRSNNVSHIQNTLLNLSELEILKEEGINFINSEFGRCFGDLEDIANI